MSFFHYSRCERGRGPVRHVVLPGSGLADESRRGHRQLDVVWSEPLVGAGSRAGAGRRVRRAEGLLRSPSSRRRTLGFSIARSARKRSKGFLGLVEARGDDVPVASAGQLAAPQVVMCARQVVGPSGRRAYFSLATGFSAPVCRRPRQACRGRLAPQWYLPRCRRCSRRRASSCVYVHVPSGIEPGRR